MTTAELPDELTTKLALADQLLAELATVTMLAHDTLRVGEEIYAAALVILGLAQHDVPPGLPTHGIARAIEAGALRVEVMEVQTLGLDLGAYARLRHTGTTHERAVKTLQRRKWEEEDREYLKGALGDRP